MSAGSFTMASLSVLSPFLVEDLGISRAELGALFTVLFVVATVASPLLGSVIDGQGSRRSLLVLFWTTALGITAIALSTAWQWLVLALIVAGLPMAAMNPLTNQLISNHIPVERQGLFMGIKQSGGQVNWFFAGVLLPSLALLTGWRPALFLGVALAIVGVVVTSVLMPKLPTPAGPTGQDDPGPAAGGDPAATDHDQDPASGGRAADTPTPEADRKDSDAHLQGSLASRVRWLAVYAFVMTLGVSAINSYLPLYAFERLEFTEARAGMLAAILGLVGVISRVLWGRGADALGRPSTLLAALAALSAVFQLGVWMSEAVGAWLLWLSVVGLGFSAFAWAALAMLALLRLVPRHLTGRGSGIMLLGGHSAMVVAPIVSGYAIDLRDGSYELAWGGATVAFVVGTVLALRQRHVETSAARALARS